MLYGPDVTQPPSNFQSTTCNRSRGEFCYNSQVVEKDLNHYLLKEFVLGVLPYQLGIREFLPLSLLLLMNPGRKQEHGIWQWGAPVLACR